MAKQTGGTPNLRDTIRAIIREEVANAVGDSLHDAVELAVLKALGEEPATNTVAAAKPAAKTRAPRAAKTTRVTKAARTAKATSRGGIARVCHVIGCDRPFRSKGYCGSHYQAARNKGWPMPPTEMFTPEN